LEGQAGVQVPLTATSMPPSYAEQNVTPRKLVSRLGFEPRTLALKGECTALLIPTLPI